MPLYLYTFGFESPRQFRNNKAHDWDDEDSIGILIEAPDEAAALAWGQELSERFVQLLFNDESVSWRKLGYSNRIEAKLETWADHQRVAVGTLPDFGSWLRPYEGEASPPRATERQIVIPQKSSHRVLRWTWRIACTVASATFVILGANSGNRAFWMVMFGASMIAFVMAHVPDLVVSLRRIGHDHKSEA